MPTIVSAGRMVVPGRMAGPGAIVIEGDRIVDVIEGPRVFASAHVSLPDGLLLPGFIDVHVHGVEGADVLDPSAPIAEVARRLPRFGVTAFCPTTVACSPGDLATTLGAVRTCRAGGTVGGARVLPAHLESNFINPEYRGAQPLSCVVVPPGPGDARPGDGRSSAEGPSFSGADILDVITAHQHEVAIVTMAPELPGALELVERLTARGHRVSLGHSGATYEEARAAIAVGARHATHLFNRMTPLHHRHPGLPAAVLESDLVAAEFICDGHHVHPALLSLALRVKGPERMIAITDGTAGSGLPWGAEARLGGRRITVRETAVLDDGTLAGSVLTMDQVFRNLVGLLGLSLAEATRLCAENPARELGLADQGRLVPGALADFVVLDRDLRPVLTYVGGRAQWAPTTGAPSA